MKRDVEKVLTELREAAKDGMGKIARLRDCPDQLQDWSIRMNAALAAFSADMPGAIGVCVAFSKINRHMTAELDAALAELEGK